MHKRPLGQCRADLERLELHRATLDVEFGTELTGAHQHIVHTHQRHVSVQIRQVGGVFHVQVRHGVTPVGWWKSS
ncbi:hypothetical protein D3C85_1861230 [compost metagenome]